MECLRIRSISEEILPAFVRIGPSGKPSGNNVYNASVAFRRHVVLRVYNLNSERVNMTNLYLFRGLVEFLLVRMRSFDKLLDLEISDEELD